MECNQNIQACSYLDHKCNLEYVFNYKTELFMLKVFNAEAFIY